jgi:hypothetical protein
MSGSPLIRVMHVIRRCRDECVRQVGQVASQGMPMQAVTIDDLAFRSCGGRPRAPSRCLAWRNSTRIFTGLATLDDPTRWASPPVMPVVVHHVT